MRTQARETVVEVMAQYTVKASRDGKFWFLHVQEIEGFTQARSLSEIDEMARDLVHIMTDEAKEDIELTIEIELPEEVTAARAEEERLRKLAKESNTRAAEKAREAARLLRQEGLTVRDLGEVLGVSYQRAQQLSKID